MPNDCAQAGKTQTAEKVHTIAIQAKRYNQNNPNKRISTTSNTIANTAMMIVRPGSFMPPRVTTQTSRIAITATAMIVSGSKISSLAQHEPLQLAITLRQRPAADVGLWRRLFRCVDRKELQDNRDCR